MKREKWKFRSKEDEEAIDAQFDAIAQKFVSLHPIGITIVVPSGNDLNMRIAEKVVSKCQNVLEQKLSMAFLGR